MLSRVKKKTGMAIYGLREARRQFEAAFTGKLRISEGQRDPVYFEAVEAQPNQEWHLTNRGRRVTWKRSKVIGPSTKVLTIGSCFAVEIRNALKAAGVDVYPKYREIAFDPATQKAGNLPERDNLNHYDTPSIRQEFERALDAGATDRADILKAGVGSKPYFGDAPMFTDPYRPGVHATSIEGALDISGRIDKCFRDAVEAADVYVITLGLIECWRNTRNGRFVWGWPVKSQHADTHHIEFHLTGFEDNYRNVRTVCARLLERYPDKRIVLTVSPVALDRTFTDNDVVIANTESKAVLRCVAGQICRDFPQVVYWPSFELATRTDVYTETGRHVRDDFVSFIVQNFLAAASTR